MATTRARKPLSAGRSVQLNLTGITRADKIARPERRPEKALSAQARQTLGLMGYASMEAGAGRRKMKCVCERCGNSWEQYPTGFIGNDIGYPDVAFMRYSHGFPGIGIFVEFKGDGTAIQPEQQRLADAGRSVIAHSIDEAIRGVLAAEEAMDVYRFPDERRERMTRFLRENEGRLW